MVLVDTMAKDSAVNLKYAASNRRPSETCFTSGFRRPFVFLFVASGYGLPYNSRFTLTGVAIRRNAETVVNIIGLCGRGSGIFSALSEDRQDVSVVHTLAGGMHSAFCLPAFRLSILNHGSFFLLDAGRGYCRNRR